MFGRRRNLAALPWPPIDQVNEDAQNYFDRMAKIDKWVADAVNKAHTKFAQRVNARRKERLVYEVGEWVFMIKPKHIGGIKIETWWLGPYKIQGRTGENSYVLIIPQEGYSMCMYPSSSLALMKFPLEPWFEMQVLPPPPVQEGEQELAPERESDEESDV